MSEKEYLILLSSFIPFGAVRIRLLLKYFGSAKKAWIAPIFEFKKLGLSENYCNSYELYRNKVNIDNFFDTLNKHNVNTIVFTDGDYPENLKGLDDAPVTLYVRGKLSISDVNAIAIVGSRKMTTYGREVTEKFSTELATLGVTIVSGLAFGVDVAAHKAALSVGGRCIAVLAGGVDYITPRSNEWLGREIIKSGGAVVSEFPLGTLPQKHFFPFRNRIISGLSKAVVVAEGAIKSGTIHTVKHALDQGRQVFAVPGQITSPMSQGPLYLIKNGARMLTETSDILEELSLQIGVDLEKVEKIMPGSPQEKQIYKILENEELHLDDIVRYSGLNVSEISGKLTVMELKGLVRNVGNGVYKKV